MTTQRTLVIARSRYIAGPRASHDSAKVCYSTVPHTPVLARYETIYAVQAQASGLLDGRADELAEQFGGLLWGNLLVSLLPGVARRPGSREIAARAATRRLRF